MERYDAIVIGSGLGGLTAGALAAIEGKKVLLLERHDRFGGAATSFARKNLTIEVGLHELDGLDACDPKRELWQHLEIERKVTPVEVPQFYQIRHPSLFPGGVNLGHQDPAGDLAAALPQAQEELKRFYKLVLCLRRSLAKMYAHRRHKLWWLLNLPIFPLRFRQLLLNERLSLKEVLERHFGRNERAKLAVAANFGYYADSTDRLGMVPFAAAQGSYLSGGSWYLKGGSQELSDFLACRIEKAGGCCRVRREVAQILVENGKAVGVRHHKAPSVRGSAPQPPEEYETAYAPVIFGNAAPSVLSKMLPPAEGPKFFKPYQDLELSPSLWTLYLGLKQRPSEFGVSAYSTFCLPEWVQSLKDQEQGPQLLAKAPQGKTPPFVLVDYSAIESGLAQAEGSYFAVLCGLDRAENWQDLSLKDYRAKKEAWRLALLEELERQFPGISEAVHFSELSTAKTIADYLNTPGGAVYGFAATPEQSGRKRPGAKTSLAGLYLASAFARPGGGFTGAMLAGQAAFEAAFPD